MRWGREILFSLPPSALWAATSLITSARRRCASEQPPKAVLSESQREALSCRIQHVFNKNAIARCGIIYQNMGHGADELAVLNDWTAAHADVK